MNEDPLQQHWKAQYENKYLGAWTLFDSRTGQYREIAARIDRVAREEVIGEGGRKSYPLVLYLSGRKGPVKTPMIVSKTSGKTLESMFGEKPSMWVGKPVALYAQKKRVRGGVTWVLVIRNNTATERMKEAMQPPPQFDDEPGEPPAPATTADDFDEPSGT